MSAAGRLWILGAADPEMEAIEALLTECGEATVYASPDGARRVSSGEAYRSDLTVIPGNDLWVGSPSGDPRKTTVYTVECALPPGMEPGRHVVIDHHRPGDPGYSRPPADFMTASSIGQVIAALGQVADYPDHWERVAVPRHPHWCGAIEHYAGAWIVRTTSRDGAPGADDDASATACVIPQGIVLTAAADHCLAAAYRGECPGVDADELMRWRVATRAAFQRRPVADVLADVERAREALREAPTIELLGVADMPHTEDHNWSRSVCSGCARDPVLVRDMRGRRVPELPEASAREGICFVADGLPGPDGRVKIVCQSATPDEIRAFFDWAERLDLVAVYGDPTRGFAGGYLK